MLNHFDFNLVLMIDPVTASAAEKRRRAFFPAGETDPRSDGLAHWVAGNK